MASISSIDTLSDISRRASEEAIARLGQANQNLQKAQQKLSILHDYHQSYKQRLQHDMQSGLTISHYNNYVGFLANLEKAVDQQRREVAMSEQIVEQHRAQWQLCERKRLSFETLKTRANSQRLIKENRREQKLNDEFAERSKRSFI